MFELQLGSDRLVAVLNATGDLFWEANAIARLLRYKAPYQFTRNPYTKDVKEVAISMPAVEKCNFRVLPHRRVLYLLAKSKYDYVRALYDCLDRGQFYIKVNHVKDFPHIKMCLEHEKGAKQFTSWLQEFKKNVLKLQHPSSPPPPPLLQSLVFSPPELPESPSLPPPELLFNQSTPPPLLPSPDMPWKLPIDPRKRYLQNPVPEPSGYTPLTPPSSKPMDLSRKSVPSSVHRDSTELECASQVSRDQVLYSPSCPIYTPSPAPSLLSEVQTTEGREEEEPKKSLLEGFSFWMDQIPPTKIYMFSGNKALCFTQSA